MKVISFKKRITYLIEAFFIYLFYFIFRSLPIESSSKFGATILGFISKFIKENNTAAQNMKMCLPHLTKNQRHVLLANSVRNDSEVGTRFKSKDNGRIMTPFYQLTEQRSFGTDSIAFSGLLKG